MEPTEPMYRLAALAVVLKHAKKGRQTRAAWHELRSYVEAMVLLAAIERRPPSMDDEYALSLLMGLALRSR